MTPRKTIYAVVSFAVLILGPRLIPALQPYHWFDPRTIPAVWDFPIPPLTNEERATGPGVEELRARRLEALASKNLLDDGHELDHFYSALLASGKPGSEPVRVLHYGDSPTTADLVTGDIRAALQKEFGDAGTGFFLLVKPWAWYNRRGVDISGSDWKVDVAGVGEIHDGFFGVGGATFRGNAGAQATWKLKDSRQRHVEISYWAQPEGGTFALEADDVEIGRVDTAAEEGSAGYAPFDLPEGTSRLTLKVIEGNVRLYGLEIRKENPGVLYSSLGINGASVTLLSRTFNASHWAAQLRHYHPDLVVLAYGTNESGYPKFVDSTWADEMRLAVRKVRNALPEASILLMSPMDRGQLNENGEIDTTPALPRLVNIESKLAKEAGVAFFNTFQAMGGQGTMARWYASEPRLVGADYIHPLPAGGKIVGDLLFRALSDGFDDYKLRQLKRTAATPPPMSNGGHAQ